LKSGVCSLASGARRRIGFDRPNAKEGNALFSNEYIAHHAATIPKLRHYLAFIERLGLPIASSLDFGLSALTDPRHVPATVRDRAGQLIALVMGSSWPTKDWSAEAYRDLAVIIIRETRLHVALVGHESHRSAAARVVDAAPPGRVIDLVGRTSLLELGATLAAARAAVGPDSGPGHLAAAVGTPHVTLFGPTHVERVVPYGCEHLAVRAPVECRGCPRRRCRRREGRCMDTITVASVWSILEPLLA
jgi:ADP-heptose:LPS heptosyltransferase